MDIIFEKNKAIAYDGNIKIGECEFLEVENKWNIVRTEVDSNYQGQGIARKLVECVAQNAKTYSKEIIADCFYAKKVIEDK